MCESFCRRPPVVILAALLLAGTVFVLVTPKALPLLGGLGAVLAIGGVGPWVTLAGTRGRVDFNRRRCRVGDTVEAVVAVSGGIGDGRGVVFADTADRPAPCSGSTQRERITLVPTRRGLFPRVPPRVESDVPFGLVVAHRPLQVARHVVVWPVTAPIRFPASLVDPRRHGRESSDRVAGGSGDVLGVREYRAGDTARSIHWAQTSRRDEVMVCERPGDGGPTVRVLVDRVVTPALPAAAHAAAFEAIVTLAASMLESWAPRGMRLEMAWADGPVQRAGGRHGLEAALDAVACLQPLSSDAGAVAPRLPHDRLRTADLDIWLTTPLRRAVFTAAAADGTGPRFGGGPRTRRSAAPKRLMIVVDPTAVAPSRLAGPAGRGCDVEIVLPATGAAAQLDRVLAEIGHDPDAPRA